MCIYKSHAFHSLDAIDTKLKYPAAWYFYVVIFLIRGKIYFQKERPEVFIAKVSAKHTNIVYKAVLVKSSSQSCGHTGLSLSNRRLNPFH